MPSRLLALFRRRRIERDLDDEIANHLALQEAEFRAAGMSSADAHRAALRDFGGVAQTREDYRDRAALPAIETAARDAAYALRGLRRSPGFTAAAVLSLALGIGANTAIFSMVHALILRMLPVAHPEELLSFHRTGGWGIGHTSWPFYLEARKQTGLFQDVAARTGVDKVRFQSGTWDRLENARRELVSGNYFSTLGVAAAIGRVFTEDDNRTPHAHPIAILSYDFWTRRFAADSTVLGRTLLVDEKPLTVIGVAARGFRGVEVERQPDLWVPAMMADGDIMQPGRNWVYLFARRRPEVSRAQAQSAIGMLFAHYLTRVYGNYPVASFRRTAMSQRIEVRDGGAGLSRLRDQFAGPLVVLMAAVGLVLLAACANVAHLLLARAATRRKEIALRFSLGATRSRLVAQSLIETLILAIAGGAVGIAFAFWGDRAIAGFLPGEPFPATPDSAVLLFTLAVSVLSAILFGLIPALKSTAVDTARQLTAAPRARMRSALVVAQVAFSVVLVVLAGLFGHSLAELRALDPGFRNQSAIALTLDYPRAWKPPQTKAARERFMDAVAAMPGVSRVSCGFPAPFLGGFSSATVRVLGAEVASTEPPWVSVYYVAPAYFDTIGAVPRTGREFARTDTAASHRVAVVNETFVRQFLPGASTPVGRILGFDSTKDGVNDPTEIVGVVHDIAHNGLREKAAAVVYVPLEQKPVQWEPAILVRSALPPGALASAMRRTLAQISPEINTTEPRTIRQTIDESIFQDRLLATLSGFFGVLALGLAAIGLYSVVAYGTTRRAREIGIRIALGARRGMVVWMVLREALLLVALGMAIGLPTSWAAARQVGSVLFGIRPSDAAAYLGTIAALAFFGAMAALLPARRAAGLDPNQILRE